MTQFDRHSTNLHSVHIKINTLFAVITVTPLPKFLPPNIYSEVKKRNPTPESQIRSRDPQPAMVSVMVEGPVFESYDDAASVASLCSPGNRGTSGFERGETEEHDEIEEWLRGATPDGAGEAFGVDGGGGSEGGGHDGGLALGGGGSGVAASPTTSHPVEDDVVNALVRGGGGGGDGGGDGGGSHGGGGGDGGGSHGGVDQFGLDLDFDEFVAATTQFGREGGEHDPRSGSAEVSSRAKVIFTLS